VGDRDRPIGGAGSLRETLSDEEFEPPQLVRREPFFVAAPKRRGHIVQEKQPRTDRAGQEGCLADNRPLDLIEIEGDAKGLLTLQQRAQIPLAAFQPPDLIPQRQQLRQQFDFAQ
jgi:hypothetical protein